jgi:uncharacterized protein YidB (DUF937 family)
MGLFESLKAQATQLLSGANRNDNDAEGEHGLLGAVMGAVQQHGLGDLLEKLHAAGLSEKVASWVGPGANLPISAEQLENGLGRETIEKFAARLGIPPEQTAAVLSQLLPHAVDKLAPSGSAEEAAAAAEGESSVESETSEEPETEPTER